MMYEVYVKKVKVSNADGEVIENRIKLRDFCDFINTIPLYGKGKKSKVGIIQEGEIRGISPVWRKKLTDPVNDGAYYVSVTYDVIGNPEAAEIRTAKSLIRMKKEDKHPEEVLFEDSIKSGGFPFERIDTKVKFNSETGNYDVTFNYKVNIFLCFWRIYKTVTISYNKLSYEKKISKGRGY